MSEADTRRLIERYLAAFNRSDHEAMLACLADDVARDENGGGREIGKEKFRWFLARSARHFRQEITDIAVMTAPGGVRAAAEFTLNGTYHATMDGLPRGPRPALQPARRHVLRGRRRADLAPHGLSRPRRLESPPRRPRKRRLKRIGAAR